MKLYLMTELNCKYVIFSSLCSRLQTVQMWMSVVGTMALENVHFSVAGSCPHTVSGYLKHTVVPGQQTMVVSVCTHCIKLQVTIETIVQLHKNVKNYYYIKTLKLS